MKNYLLKCSQLHQNRMQRSAIRAEKILEKRRGEKGYREERWGVQVLKYPNSV